LANLDELEEKRGLDLELFLATHDEKELILLKNLLDKIILKKLKENEISIPISIFSKDLSPGEALVKFLKENKNLKFSEIAKLLNKKENAIWLNYSRSKEKSKTPFDGYQMDKINLPAYIFRIEKLSYLESIIYYLRQELRLSNNELSKLLNKSPQVLSISYNHAKKKLEKK
jgi:hypothetical protein